MLLGHYRDFNQAKCRHDCGSDPKNCGNDPQIAGIKKPRRPRSTGLSKVEAEAGIEPAWADLQSDVGTQAGHGLQRYSFPKLWQSHCSASRIECGLFLLFRNYYPLFWLTKFTPGRITACLVTGEQEFMWMISKGRPSTPDLRGTLC